jgi:hypothetical protein
MQSCQRTYVICACGCSCLEVPAGLALCETGCVHVSLRLQVVLELDSYLEVGGEGGGGKWV